MSELKLFNTLTRKKEIFKPIEKDKIGIYVCGPTVNDVPHLGHARAQITFDVLRKYLLFLGYKVKFVSNITDIDDKIINKANELNEDIKELTKRNTRAHLEDYKALNVAPPDVQPKATEYVKQMISLVQLLEKKDYTYIIPDDGVYFNIKKFKPYGKLSHQDIQNLKARARIALKDQKKNKEDFVLWKFSKRGEPFWESPWGKGRPGWHIECSAMSYSILGLPFDIHGGGQDLIFPHHEDEIAQSEAAYGKKICNYWIHNGMVNVDKVKMSKSLGNFRTIQDLLNQYPGEAIRYFVLSANYRKPIDFSFQNLDAAKNAYGRLKRKIFEIKKETHKGNDLTKEYAEKFTEAMNDDLNTPKALDIFWSLINDFDFAPKQKLKLIEKFDQVLSLGVKNMEEQKIPLPNEVKALLKERESLRKQKKWAEADIIRQRIKDLGFLIEDKPEGPLITKSD
jgi:cysteinyl-tRNA synthetase